MNEEILIELGEVTKETKGCLGGKNENVISHDFREEEFPGECE